MALAVAIFVVFTYQRVNKLSPTSRAFLWMILWSLLFAACGVLPLFWMPAKTGWLTVLRYFKSVPYFYSLFSLVAGLVVFVENMRRQGPGQ